MTIAATDGIADEEQGLASGLLTTSFQFGASLGLAMVTAIIVAVTGIDGSPAAQLNGYRAALVIPLAAAVIGAATLAFGLRRRRHVQGEPAVRLETSADRDEPEMVCAAR